MRSSFKLISLSTSARNQTPVLVAERRARERQTRAEGNGGQRPEVTDTEVLLYMQFGANVIVFSTRYDIIFRGKILLC